MLQQQLRQKDEEISSKAAEIGDLKERVAALEKLQGDQQKLLAMKDTELAAAQARLAEANKAAAMAAPRPAATAVQPVATHKAETASSTPWLWGGIGILALAALAWLFTRKRTPPRPVPRRSAFDSEALAASMVPQMRDEDEVAVDAGDDATAPPTIDLASVPPVVAPRTDAPAWHSGWVKADVAAAAPEPSKARFLPTDDQPPEPRLPPQASAEQRFKLARAFLDIGDDHSARQLLTELLDDQDPGARTEASRMLRELG